jgi:hypothetical protein
MIPAWFVVVAAGAVLDVGLVMFNPQQSVKLTVTLVGVTCELCSTGNEKLRH